VRQFGKHVHRAWGNEDGFGFGRDLYVAWIATLALLPLTVENLTSRKRFKCKWCYKTSCSFCHENILHDFLAADADSDLALKFAGSPEAVERDGEAGGGFHTQHELRYHSANQKIVRRS